MGLTDFFHKVKMVFVRLVQPSIPQVSDAKRYGNYGEDEFTYTIFRELPDCKIKRNVIISTPEGNAEIDCLILYRNKLFAIVIKHWKGQLIEQEGSFVQAKTDRWTGETHTKLMKSPFAQIKRAIYLLTKQIPSKAWVNGIVFFEGDELESVSVSSDYAWFCDFQNLIYHIRNEGKASFGNSANIFFNKCVPADCLYSKEKSLNCIINRDTLRFETTDGYISAKNIVYIRISHHLYYDKLNIELANGTNYVIKQENAKIEADDNGVINNYALCKLDCIELGRTLGQ